MARLNIEEAARIVDVLAILEGKWTVHILCAMRGGPVRLGELKRSIPGASKKALTASLRHLEDGRIVVRHDMSSSVLHVEYEIADQMQKPVIALLSYLNHWPSVLGN